jgi:hypothetical protein
LLRRFTSSDHEIHCDRPFDGKYNKHVLFIFVEEQIDNKANHPNILHNCTSSDDNQPMNHIAKSKKPMNHSGDGNQSVTHHEDSY